MKRTINFLFKTIRFPIRKYIIYRTNKSFRDVGRGSIIRKPLRIQGGHNILIGCNVQIKERCWLAALPLTGEHEAQLMILDGAVLGDYNHIFATRRIVIEKKVLTANHVYISDNLHGYEDINMPIVEQPIVQLNDVLIGEGSWIGENVCIIGASVGKHCVIGANAVVTKDIPDYCVAAGVPAKVIKQYNFEKEEWQSVK